MLDTSLVYQNGRPNPNHVFNLLGSLSSHRAIDVRYLLLTDIANDVDFYQHTSCVCLERRIMGFTQWVTSLPLDTMYADKVTLLSLSWLFKQHTVVITASKLWSTLHSNDPVTEDTLLNICLVKLVYLGQLHFGVLRPRLKTLEFVMVLVAAAGPAKSTVMYNAQQAHPVSKPAVVTSIPVDLHFIHKGKKQDITLPVTMSLTMLDKNLSF